MNQEIEKNFGRRQNDLVLVELTEKIVENNNSVSSVVNLMSENLVELVEAQERMENKIDDAQVSAEVNQEKLTQLNTDMQDIKKKIEDFKRQIDYIETVGKKIEESEILKFAVNVKKAVFAIITTAAIGVAIVLLKDFIIFYLKLHP